MSTFTLCDDKVDAAARSEAAVEEAAWCEKVVEVSHQAEGRGRIDLALCLRVEAEVTDEGGQR